MNFHYVENEIMLNNPIPFQNFHLLDDAVCDEKIILAKQKLGKRLMILGHYYQRDEVYKYADKTGDSLALSQYAAASDAEFIVFCGVHFMAEVSAMLTKPEQITILPDLAAGCSMADMANLINVERAWRELGEVLQPDESITPVTYINSAADLKAFCGRHGGIICTSSNAQKILEWSFNQREKILFFPDQHLGRNTAYRMGIPVEQMVLWDFDKPLGGLTPEQIKAAKVILWKGFCSVHQKFKPEHIDDYLAKYPETKIIAHPEAEFDVCQRADYVGSTSFIMKTIKESALGTRWLVATELNLVNRLHHEFQHEGKVVKFMAPTVSMCSTMFRTDPQHLAWVLTNLAEGHIVNRITVGEKTTSEAKVALKRMLDLS